MMVANVTERTLVAQLVAGMPRSKHQVNRLHESDAEILRIPGADFFLAVTTDGVVEEIASGLYRDPYLAGWMSVTVNASDLAAVGAAPLGILISEALPSDIPDDELTALQAGIRDAAVQHDLPVLGGDTNVSASLQLTATAIGMIRGVSPLTRRGASPGDRLFASAPLGLGSAFAFERFLADRHGAPKLPFRPVARLAEGQLLARYASACMDSSDGVIATLDELMRVNGVGVRATSPDDAILHPAALATARAAGLPPWTMLAGPHGEFELLFTVPPDRAEDFLAEAISTGWLPLELGNISADAGFHLQTRGDVLAFDTDRIRNLFAAVHGDPHRYLAALMESAAPALSPS